MDTRLLLDGRFEWCIGIEDTFIGQPIRHGGHPLDEYALTQHYRYWRDDIDLAHSLGVAAMRYGIPWYRVNQAPGQFDWDWTDEVIDYAVRQKNLTIIADLVHYGVPDWIEASFADPAYPSAVAAYAEAFATRYRHLIHHYTPLNEPTITAQFCGQRGLWPPYLTGDAGWLQVVLGVVEGIRESIVAIRTADPDAIIVHVEAAKVTYTDDPALDNECRDRQERAYLPTDLLLGNVGPKHSLFRWITANGVPAVRLQRFRYQPPTVDVIGVNYYPEISVRQVVVHEGGASEVAVDGWADGLERALIGFHARYGIPLFVSETSTEGDDDRRARWLHDAVAAIDRLRNAGVPINGFTWWPLFDFVDWSHSLGDERLEDFLIRVSDGAGGRRLVPPPQPTDTASRDDLEAFFRRMGLWRLETAEGGAIRRVETSVARHYRELIDRRSGEARTIRPGH